MLFRSFSSNEYNKVPHRQVIWTARLVESEKGIIKFLSIILDLLLKPNNNIKIIIVGEGPDRRMISDFLASNSLNHIVSLKGWVSQNDMIKFYRSSDLFLLPSVRDQNPLSVIEALWSSLPLMISNRCGNHYEALYGKKNGWLLDIDNEASVRSCWQQFSILNDEELSKMGIESFATANKYFKSEESLNHLIYELTKNGCVSIPKKQTV